MLRVMSVFGTRPDTIKMAPVVAAMNASPQIEHSVCVTAQHRKMLDDLLVFFKIAPDYDLDVMTEDQSLTEITTRVLTGMEPVLREARPDVVLVHGDTTTSTAAALAAFYARIPVGHVEAGLRTTDRWLPYPEEMNRRLTANDRNVPFCADGSGTRASACRARGLRRRDRHRQYRHRCIRGNGGPRRPSRFRRGGGSSIRSVRSSWLPHIAVRTTRYARDWPKRCSRSRGLPSRPQLYWPVIRRRGLRRSRASCSARPRACCSSIRSTTARWSRPCAMHVRAHRFRGSSRGSAVSGEARARHA